MFVNFLLKASFEVLGNFWKGRLGINLFVYCRKSDTLYDIVQLIMRSFLDKNISFGGFKETMIIFRGLSLLQQSFDPHFYIIFKFIFFMFCLHPIHHYRKIKTLFLNSLISNPINIKQYLLNPRRNYKHLLAHKLWEKFGKFWLIIEKYAEFCSCWEFGENWKFW